MFVNPIIYLSGVLSEQLLFQCSVIIAALRKIVEAVALRCILLFHRLLLLLFFFTLLLNAGFSLLRRDKTHEGRKKKGGGKSWKP